MYKKVEINNIFEEFLFKLKIEIKNLKLLKILLSFTFLFSFNYYFNDKEINFYIYYLNNFIFLLLILFIILQIKTFYRIIKFKKNYKIIFGEIAIENTIIIYLNNIKKFIKKNDINEKILYDFVNYHEEKHILQYKENKEQFNDIKNLLKLEKEADEYLKNYLINNLNYNLKDIKILEKNNLFY